MGICYPDSSSKPTIPIYEVDVHSETPTADSRRRWQMVSILCSIYLHLHLYKLSQILPWAGANVGFWPKILLWTSNPAGAYHVPQDLELEHDSGG